MLRHIISVSLAMTACAAFIPIKANAIDFTLTPLGSLQRSPGERISFILRLDPQGDAGLFGVQIQDVFNLRYDSNELSTPAVIPLFTFSERRLTTPTNIAALAFDVTNPIKDGRSDISSITIKYLIDSRRFEQNISYDRVTGLDVQPTPEPLTMFGAAAAIGYGAILKRKYSKNTES
jgi:hypothetical protein